MPQKSINHSTDNFGLFSICNNSKYQLPLALLDLTSGIFLSLAGFLFRFRSPPAVLSEF
jgi:hypothetical protein